jgi:hypothetical protein
MQLRGAALVHPPPTAQWGHAAPNVERLAVMWQIPNSGRDFLLF